MVKSYQEVPSNFSEIQNYIVQEKEKVIEEYYDGENYFFYDTCSILHHSKSVKKNLIIQYLKNHRATIIITRTVLMELTSNNFELHPIQVAFFKELHINGLKILLFNEEFIIDCLKEFSNINNVEANKLLGHAINEVSRSKTAIYDIKNSIDASFRNKIVGNNPGNVLLYDDFFRYARSQKTTGDSLAEELMFICIIVLTKIPLGKYILVSDDLRIRSKVIEINNYLLRHHEVKEPFQLTTPALIYRLYKESIVTTSSEMLDILNSAFDGNINVHFISEYDIIQQQGTFTKDELIARLISEKEFRIIY